MGLAGRACCFTAVGKLVTPGTGRPSDSPRSGSNRLDARRQRTRRQRLGTGRGYSIDDFVGDLLAFVATLDQAPVLVGASLGGITSLVAAGEHPGLARGLVLVDVVVVDRTGGRETGSERS